MIVRQLKAQQYEKMCRQLAARAKQASAEASFQVDMVVDGQKYRLKLQPETRHRMVALQALAVEGDMLHGQRVQLITDNKVISALLELFIRETNVSLK